MRLLAVDEAALPALLALAVADAEPHEVLPPPHESSWTDPARAAFEAYHRSRRDLTFAVLGDDGPIGCLRLARVPGELALELGLWLGRSHRGQHLAGLVQPLAAAKARSMGADRLVARTTSANPAALRALARQGFALHPDDDGQVEVALRL